MAAIGNASSSSRDSENEDMEYEELASLETMLGNGYGTRADPIIFDSDGEDEDESIVEVWSKHSVQHEQPEPRNAIKVPNTINIPQHFHDDETEESNPPDSEVEQYFDGSSMEDTEPTEDYTVKPSWDFEDDMSFSNDTAPPKFDTGRNARSVSEEHEALPPEKVDKQKARFNVSDNVHYKSSIMIYGAVKVTARRKTQQGFEYRIDWNGQSRWWPEDDFEELSTKRLRKPNTLINISRERECRPASSSVLANETDMRTRVETALSSLPCTFQDGIVSHALESIGDQLGLENVLERIQSVEGGVVPISFPHDEFNIGDRVSRVMDSSVVEARIEESIDSDSDSKMYRVVYKNGSKVLLLPRQLRTPFQGNARRGFHFLELFSGSGVMSKAFQQLGFTVQSVDIATDEDAVSPPTLELDVNLFQPDEHMDKIPDVVHISLPCETYSNLSGDHHRVTTSTTWKDSNLDISPEAREHDFLFVKVIEILVYIKQRNPNVVVIIENPKAKLRHMPLMKLLEQSLKLTRAQVCYCAFGHAEKKPTDIWTSHNVDMCDVLNQYTCSCPLGTKHDSIRDNVARNYAKIPELLARLLAEGCNAHLIRENLRNTQDWS